MSEIKPYPIRIPVSGPWVSELEVEYVADAARTAWYENANIYHQRFESAAAKYLGVQHSISLPHCTAGLHLALAAKGIGPGDEVIVPEITWIATSAPIKYVGATPVFCDVDEQTWCLDVNSFKKCITKNTKAVIPVDLYGGMPNYPEINQVAKDHGIFVIEDAAEAFGASLLNKKAGAWGDVGVFSFHGSKTITTGEGGLLVSDDTKLCERILFLRDHGRVPGDTLFRNAEVAFKYKMSSFQAAFGLAQIERVGEILHKKREIFSWYHNSLKDLEGVTMNQEPAGMYNTYWMVSIVPDESYQIKKHDLMARLLEYNIDTRPFFSPLSSIPAYANLAELKGASERNPVSYKLHASAINLPSALNLDEEKVAYVCQVLKQILHSCRSR